MNVMGEVVSMLGLSAIAGLIIGWCIRNFFGGEKKARQHFARDMDEAAKDAKHLRRTLVSKDHDLQEAKTELQQLRRQGSSSESDTRMQVAEINNVKNQLAASQKTLHNNQSEFNTFRNEAQKEQNDLRSELAKFSKGGVANPERLNEANETIGALRSAVRENDKVIDSLRARVKEGDSTVENLRSQLKSSESVRSKDQTVTQEYDKKLEALSRKADDSATTIDKQKRDYDLMLENKNRDIKNLQTKIEEMTNSSSTLQTREHEFGKEVTGLKEKETKFKSEIVDLKRVISDRDQALTKARQRTTELTEQVTSLKEVETNHKAEIGTLKRVTSDRDQALTKTRQHTTELTEQVKSVREHEERELERMQAKVKDATEVKSKIKSKSAEVSALNEMLTDSANKRNVLQKDVNNLKRTLDEKDVTVAKLRSEMDDVVASRNKVSSQLGELQTKGNVALEKLQQDFNNLAKTRDQYKSSIDNLQNEVTELKSSKQQLDQLTDSSKVKEEKLKGESKVWQSEVKKLNTTTDEYKRKVEGLQGQLSEVTQAKDGQLHELRNQLNKSKNEGDSKVTQVTSDFSKRNTMLQNDLKTLQAKVNEQSLTIENKQSDLDNQLQINKRAATKIAETERKLTEFRTKLHQEESESQRLNRQLSEAESVRLTLTERDAELRKTQIELQDAAASGAPLQAQFDDQKQQHETLLRAMQERDEELARLNTQMTNNRLRSKQQQSSITLLTQDKDAQSDLIKSLEKQAENTLHLHTKIAAQSTELEGLRARLFERDNSPSASNATSNTTSNRVTAQSGLHQSGLQQIETGNTSATKPRVFVRSDADAETLTGVTDYQTRPQLTADGHRTQRPDGTDDLSLLAGVTPTVAGALGRFGITAFEQIASWGDREVAHYAERVGIPVQRAQQYNWPSAASSVLNGTYKTGGQKVDH